MASMPRPHRLAFVLALVHALGACPSPDADDEHDADAQTSDGNGEAGAGDSQADGGDATGVGQPCAGASTQSGEATYYDFADGSGNCGFPATPDDLMVGAMNHTDYAASAACGLCVRIEHEGASVDVRIVDQCPECAPGDIDLSPDAFARIAALEAGRVPITWQTIECPVDGPVVYHFKDGSNPYWTAIQIRNHRHGIASLQYLREGTWTDVARVDYNYFVADGGMGEGPLSLRVTDVLGNTLQDDGIPLLDDADAAGAAQFPGCGG